MTDVSTKDDRPHWGHSTATPFIIRNLRHGNSTARTAQRAELARRLAETIKSIHACVVGVEAMPVPLATDSLGPVRPGWADHPGLTGP